VIALCVESSHGRGMGHLFRALNLADGLRASGHKTLFLVNPAAAGLNLLAERGYPYEAVPLDNFQDDWESTVARRNGIRLWINDRLNTDQIHARRVKSLGLPLVSFDDRGTGAELADINVAALDFNESTHIGGSRVLRGPNYLILDPEIARYKRLRTNARSLLVTMGGSDTHGVTVSVVKHLASIDRAATVVVGPAFAHQEALKAAMTPSFELMSGLPSLIKEFNRHDLAITGGGITPFEAAASGLPCVVIANEHFEIPVGHGLARLGAAVFAGHHEDIDWRLLSADLPVAEMSRMGLERVGLDGCRRVLAAIASYC